MVPHSWLLHTIFQEGYWVSLHPIALCGRVIFGDADGSCDCSSARAATPPWRRFCGRIAICPRLFLSLRRPAQEPPYRQQQRAVRRRYRAASLESRGADTQDTGSNREAKWNGKDWEQMIRKGVKMNQIPFMTICPDYCYSFWTGKDVAYCSAWDLGEIFSFVL